MLKPFNLGFKSRVARWCFVALMAIGIVVPILTDLTIPSPVLAADCNWTSATSMSCGGTTWTESGLTGNAMTLTDGNGCKALQDAMTVNPYKTATTATFVTYQNDIHGTCSSNGGTFTIGNTFASTPTPTTSPSQATEPTDCNAGPGFTWLICGMIDVLAKAVDWIRENILVPLLTVPPLTQTGPDATIYKLWASFRNLSSIFFILVFFMVIFGTALGFDNYTIKKILPRLIAGAILVSFSWYICVIAIDIGNVVGQGVLALAQGIVPPPQITLNTGLDVLLIGGLLATAIAGYVIASLGLVFTILIAVVVAFAILVFRQIAITIMVILSPFALLAWILPNTERFFKLWWTSFIRLIIMYPIIMMLFIAGYIFSDLAGAGAYGGAGDKFLQPFLALVGLYAPLLLVPMTFSWGGKAMAVGGNLINKAGSAANARWGKDSTSAKERHERFQAKQAAKLKDPEEGNAFTRGLRRRQSGTGGFVFGRDAVPQTKVGADGKRHVVKDEDGNIVYKKRPFTQNTAQKLKQHEMGEKYEHLEGSVKGIEQFEHQNPHKDLNARVGVAAAATYDKMFAQNQAAALYATKLNGTAARDEYLGGGTKTAEAAVAAAKASGDHEALMTALSHPEAGGLNHLEYHARKAAAAGDEVTLAAVASRLVMSGGGSNRMQDIATGHTLLTKDAQGNVRAVGGNGMNAVGTGYKDEDGFFHDGWKAKNGTVHKTQALAEAAEHGGPGAEHVEAYSYWGASHKDAAPIHNLVAAEKAFDQGVRDGKSEVELKALGDQVKTARVSALNYQKENGLSAALGGDFRKNVDEKHLDAWNRGATGSKQGDFNKPQAAASTDFSAADYAGMHWSEKMRRINYAQNGDDPGAVSDLSKALAGEYASPVLRGKVTSDARKIDANIDGVHLLNGKALLDTPEQHEAARFFYQASHPEEFAPTMTTTASERINQAIGHDAGAAGALHAVIQQEGGAAVSPTLATLNEHVAQGATNQTIQQTVNNAITNVPRPAPEHTMDPRMYEEVLKQTKNNWDETHKLVGEYQRADNDEFRARADEAFREGRAMPGLNVTGKITPPRMRTDEQEE